MFIGKGFYHNTILTCHVTLVNKKNQHDLEYNGEWDSEEVFINYQWRTVIRYDSAHGFPHIDRYYLDGRKVKKRLHLNFGDVITLADEDIKQNWKSYQKTFMEGK